MCHNLLPLISDKARNSFLASTVKRNSLAGAEVLQVGVNLATDRMREGSDSPLDCTPLLDGQNTVAACMAGGSMFSGQRNFNVIRERLGPIAHNSSRIYTDMDSCTHHSQTGSFWTWIDIAAKSKKHNTR